MLTVGTRWHSVVSRRLEGRHILRAPQLRLRGGAVRSMTWVGDFSRLESTTWRWWTWPGSNRWPP